MDRDAQAAETRIERRELLTVRFEVHEVRRHDFRQPLVHDARGFTAHGDNRAHVAGLETFTQNALSDHAGGAEDQDVHESRSCMPIFAAWTNSN